MNSTTMALVLFIATAAALLLDRDTRLNALFSIVMFAVPCTAVELGSRVPQYLPLVTK